MKNTLEIKIVTDDEDYAKAMEVRQKVFVEELGIPKEKDFDGNDHNATHVLALLDGKPVGTMRIRYFHDFVKLERMCVVNAYRRTDISDQIMQKALLFCAQKGFKEARAVCKKELLKRWKKDGFQPVQHLPKVSQNGMTLVPIKCKLPKVRQRITFRTSFETLNAKEDEWFNNKVEREISRVKKLLNKLHHREKTSPEKGSLPPVKPPKGREL